MSKKVAINMGAVMMDVEVGFVETDPRVEEFLLEEDEESYEASFEEEMDHRDRSGVSVGMGRSIRDAV